MDGGAWPARWPPPTPPQPSAALAHAPPPPSQMVGTNPRYHLRPFAAAAAMPDRLLSSPAPRSLPDRLMSSTAPTLDRLLSKSTAPTPDRLLSNPTAAMPDRLLSNSTAPMLDRFLPSPSRWSSQSGGQPAKPVPPSSDPLLVQAPGNYYGYPYASSHVLDLKALLHTPNTSNAASAIGLTRSYSPLGDATAALPKYPRTALSAAPPNYLRSSGLLAGSSVEQSPLGALFLNASSTNVQGTLPRQSSTSVIDGISHGARQFQDPGAHKLASKSSPRHQPALPGDRIRVSCLNVGGEFFMGEAGLFGILCSCHQLRMSVAKFCEHAGGPAEKAGEIVLVENGMSIAYWFNYCIGVGAYGTDTKWDWPEWACIDYSPEGHRLKSRLAGNNSVEKVGLFSGHGKITAPINRTKFSSDLHNEGRGYTTVEKLVNKRDEPYGRGADVHTSFTKNYALPQNPGANLGLDKNHTIDAANLNQFSRPSGNPYFTASTGGHYTGNHFSQNYANLLGKNFDDSFRNPTPRSTGVLSYDSRVDRSNFPNKIFQDTLGSASNTELKLGQSSYHHSLSSLFPSVQSTSIDFQKPQSHLTLITQNPFPRQTIKVNKSIGEHTEPPLGTGTNKQSIKVANGINGSEGGKLADDSTKNPFISLFLSHLERNSEAIDSILNSSEHNLPKASDGAYSSSHSKIASRQFEPRANDNHSKLASTSIHAERRSDGRSFSMKPSGYVSNVSPLADSQEPLVHSDCQLNLLPRQSNAGICKFSARVSCPENCRSCNHVGISNQIAHAETGAPCRCDKMGKGHSTSECVDDLCTHKRMKVAEIICQCGNSCSLPREFLPSFGPNDQSTLGKLIHQCCHKVKEDVSRLGFRAGDCCQTHISNDGAPIHKPTIAGQDKLCTCSTFIKRSSLCSKEHRLQSSCREYPFDGLYYRSCMGHATNSLTKYPLLDELNKKAPDLCFDGPYCYSAVPKCLAGCEFTKHCDVGIDQSGSNVQKSKHDWQLPARFCTLGESEKLRFQCSRKAQISCLKDVSNKIADRPCIPTLERLQNVSEESVANVNLPCIAVTEKKGSCRVSGVCKEQIKPGFSSGSSSAVVTKFSVSPEVNDISSRVDKYSVEREKPVFDEGSRTDNSSSSSYVPISTGCEKSQNSSSRFHLDTSKVKRKCNQISDGSTLNENEKEQYFEKKKKSRRLKCSAEHSESDDCTRKITLQSSQNGDPQPQNEASSDSCRVSKIKRKHTTMQRNKPMKRPHSYHKILKGDEQSGRKGIMVGELDSSDEKNQVEGTNTLVRGKNQQKGIRVYVRKPPKYVSLNCIVNEPNSEDACSAAPCADSSLIATGRTDDNRKFPKIVPLNLILKKAQRCHAVKPPYKTENIQSCEEQSVVRPVSKYSFGNRNCSPQDEDATQSSRKKRYSSNALRPHIEPDRKIPCIDLGEGEPIDLTDVETSQLLVPASRTGLKNPRSSVSLNRIKTCEESANGSGCSPSGDKQSVVLALEANAGRYKERLSSDDSCCVCGIPYLEPCNQLMECGNCYIKVHRACYGVLKVPRGQWFCRPCKTNANSQDIVCVLCGYGGGAMTRALKAQKILRSLLKGLRITAWSDKDVKHNPFYESRSKSSESISRVDKQKTIDCAHEEHIVSSSRTTNRNSSLLGPQTMQWVHVVCGLWTPGTKCPNAATMNAFDVSCALPAKRNIACSMCNRTGGSYMMCRDINCSVIFHPWCAHQRGLLQTESEGERNKNIGFYGRCLNHATLDCSNRVKPEKECSRGNDWTCARTEGFKGRKVEGCHGSNYKEPQVNSSKCSVPQEQINAWLRINGSKPCIGRQMKGWKHLVVYKSGIHGLGLYTAEFIPRGSLVIEYVGEIVGQRVADKRETEYHSGKRQQYKSVCYFFRIDKEHIIDATRKGGIARFINHSCLPNCVAKIISVRNEKKVVFFSLRHINPGEEITYDYHFNQEDEGERIPCFCRSRSCRRYLN
ncbi:unnamed protein product [Alopecurus aequalis]